MARKALTAEQEAKRDARRAQFRALWKQVADTGETERAILAAKYGFQTVEGHPLSLCNSMLIALQRPTASVLGGFRQWLAHGRAVRKGEHGAMIWVPCGGKCATPENPEQSQADNGDTRFVIGTLFDITQTDEIQNA